MTIVKTQSPKRFVIPFVNYSNWFKIQMINWKSIKTQMSILRKLFKIKKQNEKTNELLQNIILNDKIKWNKERMGFGIVLSDGDQKTFIDDYSFQFKTIIANHGFESGIGYWEIELDERTEYELKIGVTNRQNINYNQAFSNKDYGWAYYGTGQLHYSSNKNSSPFGIRFKNHEIIGVYLNMNEGELMYSFNGKSLGCAFKNEQLKVGLIYPTVALLNYGGRKISS